MKINLIILSLFVVFGTSCTNKTVVLSEGELPEDIFYLADQIKPFTGKCYIYFSNSQNLKEELNFKNGILNGLRISYYNNGQIKRQGIYKDGRYNGIWKAYDESGTQVFEAEYKMDMLTGKYISWHKTGVIKEKGLYNNNTKVGEWVSYDEAGMFRNKLTL
jgi:uncharacterized protein